MTAEQRDTVVRAQLRQQAMASKKLTIAHFFGEHKNKPAVKCDECRKVSK